MTSDKPTSRTSNYGWALWHLEEASKAYEAGSNFSASLHSQCAQTRAILAQVAEMSATRGVDPNGPSTWTEDPA